MVLRHKVLSLLVTTCILFSENTLSSAPPAPFTAEQEARIGKIAGDYLLAHPEILGQVSQKLQQQQNARKQLHYGMKVMEHQSELLIDPDTPSSGPDDAAVAVIEFFDYQCIFCSQLAPVMEQIMGTSPDVRFIFKEWPISLRNGRHQKTQHCRGSAYGNSTAAKPTWPITTACTAPVTMKGS